MAAERKNMAIAVKVEPGLSVDEVEEEITCPM